MITVQYKDLGFGCTYDNNDRENDYVNEIQEIGIFKTCIFYLTYSVPLFWMIN